MNEKLQYAEMLEIPVNTASVTTLPAKKRRFKKVFNNEKIKSKLLQKVNGQVEAEPEQNEMVEETIHPVEDSANIVQEVEDFKNVINEVDSLPEEPLLSEQPEPEYVVQDYTSTVNKKVKKRFNVVTVQFAIIGVLLATILLTNAFMPNSALNVFMKNVFGGQEETMQTVDNRVFSDFTPVMQSNAENVLTDNGVTTFNLSGSVYSSCDGKVVSSIKGEDGKYTVTVEHSQNFTSVFSGLDFVYSNVGEKVLAKVPVGYIDGGLVSMCFFDGNGVAITGYTINDNAIIWAV